MNGFRELRLSRVVLPPVEIVVGEEVAVNGIRSIEQPDDGDDHLSEPLRFGDVLLRQSQDVADLGPAYPSVNQEEERADFVEEDPFGISEQLHFQLIQISNFDDGIIGVIGVREEGVHPGGAEAVHLSLGEAELLKMDDHERK